MMSRLARAVAGLLVVALGSAGAPATDEPLAGGPATDVMLVPCCDLCYCTHPESLPLCVLPAMAGPPLLVWPPVQRLKLDLFHPKGAGPFPAMVLLHGTGPLNKGHKNPVLVELAKTYARKGYVGVTMTYRWKPEEPFPAAIHDAKCAIRWLRANADRFQIDKKRVGVQGFSAGGGLALLLALAPETGDLEGKLGPLNESSRIQAAVSWFGPTDFEALHAYHADCLRKAPWSELDRRLAANYVKGGLEKWLCGAPDQSKDRYRQASPITYAQKQAPPILLLHGGDDWVVPVTQSRRLLERLKSAGADARLEVFAGAPHDFDDKGDKTAQAAATVAELFFAKHLQHPKR